MNGEYINITAYSKPVRTIIYEDIVIEKDTKKAVNNILKLPIFNNLMENSDEKIINEFAQHVKRYLLMYLPSAGFEISDTTRYNGVQGCVISTKQWIVGDEVFKCTGMIACLKSRDYHQLIESGRDFSVMYSQRKNSNCLFLGPARFMNHDCESNCKFITKGNNSITFKVVRKIDVGEEMTAFYGSHYFGVNNCECRCASCERNGKGYYAQFVTKYEQEFEQKLKEENSNNCRRSTRTKRKKDNGEYIYHIDRKTRLSANLNKKNKTSFKDRLFDNWKQNEYNQKLLLSQNESSSPSSIVSSPNMNNYDSINNQDSSSITTTSTLFKPIEDDIEDSPQSLITPMANNSSNNSDNNNNSNNNNDNNNNNNMNDSEFDEFLPPVEFSQNEDNDNDNNDDELDDINKPIWIDQLFASVKAGDIPTWEDNSNDIDDNIKVEENVDEEINEKIDDEIDESNNVENDTITNSTKESKIEELNNIEDADLTVKRKRKKRRNQISELSPELEIPQEFTIIDETEIYGIPPPPPSFPSTPSSPPSLSSQQQQLTELNSNNNIDKEEKQTKLDAELCDKDQENSIPDIEKCKNLPTTDKNNDEKKSNPKHNLDNNSNTNDHDEVEIKVEIDDDQHDLLQQLQQQENGLDLSNINDDIIHVADDHQQLHLKEEEMELSTISDYKNGSNNPNHDDIEEDINITDDEDVIEDNIEKIDDEVNEMINVNMEEKAHNDSTLAMNGHLETPSSLSFSSSSLSSLASSSSSSALVMDTIEKSNNEDESISRILSSPTIPTTSTSVIDSSEKINHEEDENVKVFSNHKNNTNDNDNDNNEDIKTIVHGNDHPMSISALLQHTEKENDDDDHMETSIVESEDNNGIQQSISQMSLNSDYRVTINDDSQQLNINNESLKEDTDVAKMDIETANILVEHDKNISMIDNSNNSNDDNDNDNDVVVKEEEEEDDDIVIKEEEVEEYDDADNDNDGKEKEHGIDSYFDDNDSDVSSTCSFDIRSLKRTIKDDCIRCKRKLYPEPKQEYTRIKGTQEQYEELRQYARDRCWRCSRHFIIYQLEWPLRRNKYQLGLVRLKNKK
ncbi:unnamed protein product [Cunninghamella blakesleeana]